MNFRTDITRPFIIAGPCSAESREQMLKTAEGVKKAGANALRAGLWKPRTHPGAFEGVGEKGLPWLVEAGRTYGLKTCTEVAGAQHVEACLKAGVDFVWIGARTTASPFLVQEIADALKGTGLPVFVKNPVSPDVDLWLGALERLEAAGVESLGVIHRGFPTYEAGKYRNSPQWQVAIEMRTRRPELPFLCDPSHIAGDREYVAEIAKRAMDLGLDGLMVETHCCPQEALSDSRQQLTPDELASLIGGLAIREAAPSGAAELSALRARIDELDAQLVDILAKRMAVSREIGERKKNNNIALVQASRWDEVLGKALEDADAAGLDRSFVESVFNRIHEASVSEQDKILNNYDRKQ